MKFALRSIALVLTLLTLACQTTPTKVQEQAEPNWSLLQKNAVEPIEIDERTVLVDARSAFDYSLSHIPSAINLPWEEFAQPKNRAPGLVTADVGGLIKQLALKGLSPEVRVIVVGNGLKGQGEEGRVAWSLLHLGFRDVQVANIEQFHFGWTQVEAPPRENRPEWQANVRSQMVAGKDEVMRIATQKLGPGERLSARILDVRSRQEYFAKTPKGEGYVTPDLNAIHIPWEQFFTNEGRPKRDMKNQLLSMGWQPNDRIVVISNKGLRSGAVAFSLMSIGFRNVANATGGYVELTTHKKKGPKLRPLGK